MRPCVSRREATKEKATIYWKEGKTGQEKVLLDPNAWSSDGFAPLHLASFFSRGDAVRLLLDRGADVGAVARNDMKVQPLHSAVAAQSTEIVAALLVAGADPNARQQDDFTPYMAAAQIDDPGLMRLLQDHGAETAS